MKGRERMQENSRERRRRRDQGLGNEKTGKESERMKEKSESEGKVVNEDTRDRKKTCEGRTRFWYCICIHSRHEKCFNKKLKSLKPFTELFSFAASSLVVIRCV